MFALKAAMLMKTTPAPAGLHELHRLLDAGQSLSATYGGGLSNHLPMAQQALLELGVSTERLLDFTEAHKVLLEPRGCAELGPIAPASDLGRPASDAAWRLHFTGRISALGCSDALREALQLLLPGSGAIAFHGLIRTSHAVLADHPGELAAGLAHWASHFMPLPVASDGPPLALTDWLQALAALPRPAYPPRALIADRMRVWGGVTGFDRTAGSLQQDDETLRELALLAARTYAATGNFTVLHLLTACHAMAVLAPWRPVGSEVMRNFSAAAAAGLLASAAVPVLELDRAPGRPWSVLISAACVQNDPHVIKLAHAAWRLDQCWADPAWRVAVERAIPD